MSQTFCYVCRTPIDGEGYEYLDETVCHECSKQLSPRRGNS